MAQAKLRWCAHLIPLGLSATAIAAAGCSCDPGGATDAGPTSGDEGPGTSGGPGNSTGVDDDGTPATTSTSDGTTTGDPGTSTGGDTDGGAFDCEVIHTEAPTTPEDLGIACAPAAIVNPSFELPVITPPWQRFDSDGSDSGIPGWVGNVDVHHSSDLSVAPDDGVQIVDLNQSGPGSIEQAITLVAGTQYRLSFYHGVNHHCTASAQFRVEIAGATRVFDSDVVLTRSTLDFTADADDTVLRFTSLTDGCGAATIDAISIDCPAIAPTTVFGQPDATETVPNTVTAARVFHPQGVVVDRTAAPNRVYVWDSGNGRVLGFAALGVCEGSGAACTHDGDCDDGSGCAVDPMRPADLVFGQRDMASATCNGDNTRRMSASAATLCGQYYPNAISLLESADPNALAVDEMHALYVVDKWNHRVLRYDDPFGSCDTVADFVYGQADFVARACNRGGSGPGADTLCINSETGNHLSGDLLGSGVDATGDAVWITDGGNHRVLRYGRDAAAADLVLGQPDFVTTEFDACNPASPDVLDDVHLCRPKAVRHDVASDRLLVLDWPDAVDLFRVVIFAGPFASGMAASEVIVGTPTGGAFERWNRPSGLELDPDDPDAFWLVDSNHSRLLRYERIAGSWVAQAVISQFDLDHVGAIDVHCPTGTNADCLVDMPGGSLGFDAGGNLLVSELGLERVMRFPPGVPAADDLGGEAYPSDATVLAPQDGLQISRPINRVTGSDLFVPNAVLAVDYGGGDAQMIVSDQYRVLAWNDFATASTGAPADVVLLQDDFESMQNGTGHSLLGLDADASGRVFIGTGIDVRVYQGPLVTGAAPIATVPGDIPLASGGGSLHLEGITGLAYDALDDVLWIADNGAHRVVRVSAPLDDAARAIDMVLGQPSASSTDANRGHDIAAEQACPNVVADGFGNLGMLKLDRERNLYVVDATHEGWQCSNNRIVEYDRAALVPGPDVFFADGDLVPARVYGADTFTERGGGHPDDQLDTPIGLAFDADNRMIVVADAYANTAHHRVFAYGDPLPSCAPCSVAADAVLPVAVSQASDAAFDSAGNLLVLDHTWARILLLAADDLAPLLPPAP